MSTKRKKNSRNPAGKTVTYIQIHEPDSPWDAGEWYMCGMCGHAINFKEVNRHARNAHHANSLRLLDVDDTPLTEAEAELVKLREAAIGNEKNTGIPGVTFNSGSDLGGSGESIRPPGWVDNAKEFLGEAAAVSIGVPPRDNP